MPKALTPFINCSAIRLARKITVVLGAVTFFLSHAVVVEGQENNVNELSIELTDYAQEAINSGVLLTIDCEFAHVNKRLFLNFTENLKKHQFTLSRHTLSNRYVVKRDDLATPHMFRSIPEATNYIAAEVLSLMESYTSYDAQRKMRISLNKFELPAPMRLHAFLLDNWDLDTGWLTWNFES